MSFLLVALVAVVVVAVAAGAVALTLTGRRSYKAANQIVPGVDTRAPKSWAGAHTPEAKLHRRLRDAVRALHAGPLADDTLLLDLRVTLEQQALAIDDRLIAVAALPDRVRAQPLAQVEAAVRAIEDATADLTSRMLGAASPQPAIEELNRRLDSVAAAREELDRTFPTG